MIVNHLFTYYNSVRGDCWTSSVEIQVFPRPTGYMWTSFGFSLLIRGIFYKIILNGLVISLKSEIGTGYFSNSTSSSMTSSWFTSFLRVLTLNSQAIGA
jgi:hypothetical protein